MVAEHGDMAGVRSAIIHYFGPLWLQWGLDARVHGGALAGVGGSGVFLGWFGYSRFRESRAAVMNGLLHNARQ